MNAQPDQTEYLTTGQAAAFLGLSPNTLNTYRVIGGGPPVYKFGRWIRYARTDLDTWARERARRSATGDP